MRVLVLGRPSAERRRVEKLLDGAGDVVDVCHDGDWGCVGIDDHCPLDGQGIDVAVAVAERGAEVDAQGVACVHRARIPLVTVGARAQDPVTTYSTAGVTRVDDDALDVIRRAANDGSGHRDAVEQALATHLAEDEQVSVTVRRRTNELDVVLTGDLSPARSSALADVARGAVRAHDGRVAVINVSSAPPATN